MLLLELLLSTGLPLSESFTAVVFDEVMIITGLIGALISSQYKWGLFAFGCAAEIYIWYVLLGPARASATRLGPDFKKAYLGSAAVLSFLWLLYPVCWGLSDGGNVIKPTSEMIFYGVLDVLAKPVFCFYHCIAMSKCNYERLGFSSGKYSDGLTEEELANNEKYVGAPVGARAHHGYNGNTTGMVQTPNTPRESTATRVEAGAEQHAAGHPQFKPVNA
jgi:bacteriorhodopsin